MSTSETDRSARPAPTVWPTLQAHDAPALIDFYVNTFGFRRTAVYEHDGLVAHAQLDWPDGGGIMLGSYRPGADWTREPGTLGAYVVTDDVDGVYARVQSSGARITRELAEQDYGGASSPSRTRRATSGRSAAIVASPPAG